MVAREPSATKIRAYCGPFRSVALNPIQQNGIPPKGERLLHPVVLGYGEQEVNGNCMPRCHGNPVRSGAGWQQAQGSETFGPGGVGNGQPGSSNAPGRIELTATARMTGQVQAIAPALSATAEGLTQR